MSDPKKAMAYQHNKMALASADFDQCMCILTLADWLNLMLMAKSSLANWEQKLTKNWANFGNLEIISWHNLNGGRINNTTDATNPSILLPVQDSATNQRCASGVKFVQIQLVLNFPNLNTIQGASNTFLRGKYYIQLPQSTIQLTNAAGNQYRSITFTGPADLHTLSANEVKHEILDVMHQDGPFNLLAPAFNLLSCRMDSSSIYGELKTLVVLLASDTIHNQIFSVLVPGYLVEPPQTVLDHIWQSYTDANCTPHWLGAQVYYSTFLNVIIVLQSGGIPYQYQHCRYLYGPHQSYLQQRIPGQLTQSQEDSPSSCTCAVTHPNQDASGADQDRE